MATLFVFSFMKLYSTRSRRPIRQLTDRVAMGVSSVKSKNANVWNILSLKSLTFAEFRITSRLLSLQTGRGLLEICWSLGKISNRTPSRLKLDSPLTGGRNVLSLFWNQNIIVARKFPLLFLEGVSSQSFLTTKKISLQKRVANCRTNKPSPIFGTTCSAKRKAVRKRGRRSAFQQNWFFFCQIFSADGWGRKTNSHRKWGIWRK